jgi:hypothetical protein
VGTYGRNQINDVFDELAKKCSIYSYSENQLSFSLEFTDGKIMLAPKVIVSGDAWSEAVLAVGKENLGRVFSEPDILALVNWGELDFSTQLWRSLYGFLAEKSDMSKHVIVDLADCLRRTDEEIGEIIEILESFAMIRTVTLSLNESEAMEIGKHYKLAADDDYGKLCESLASRIGVHGVVLHGRHCCFTCEAGVCSALPTQFNESPKLSTGGGDNFNAGYAIGLLLGLRGEVCNVFGNSMSSYYIKHGKSPDLDALRNHMKLWYMELQ